MKCPPSIALAAAAAWLTVALPSSAPLRADDGGPALQPSSFDYPAPEPGTYRLPPIKKAADGAVLDEHGRPTRLLDHAEGRISLLSFFYGSCDDEHGCPLAISTLMSIYQEAQQDTAIGRNLKILSQSFDPARDTPHAMARLRRELLGGGHAIHHDAAASKPPGSKRVGWEFLTARDEAALVPLLKAYGQPVVRNMKDDPDKIAHLLRVFLIDRNGMIRNIYGVAYMNPDVLLADIRTLLLEEAQGGAGR